MYLVFNAERHHIVDWETLLNLGFKREQIRPCGASAAAPEGAPLTRLLKGSGDQVYWLESGLRRHIPDMVTFCALGYREQDVSAVADALLATWPLGEPLPPQPPVTATPALALPPTMIPPPTLPPGTLRDALFKDVTGFDGVRFYGEDLPNAEDAAVLVVLRTSRGYNLACGSRFASPDALHVADLRGNIYDLGTVGTGTVVQTVGSSAATCLATSGESYSTPWMKPASPG